MTALIWLVSILGYLALGYLGNFILFHCWPNMYNTGDYWEEPTPFFTWLFAPLMIIIISIYWLVKRFEKVGGNRKLAEIIFFKPRGGRR